jgi:hypothetical protein
VNEKAAKARGWTFVGTMYLDSEGYLMADQFGQELG